MSATNRGAKRVASDFYPTPLESFTPLIPYLRLLPQPIWEPACGDARLIVAMKQESISCGGSDLQTGGYDFLKDTDQHQTILTNPPFTLAQQFCEHAINHSKCTVMLLRLNFLGSKKRKQWWLKNEPDAIFVLSSRPDFTGEGGDACEYGWFVWGGPYSGITHL